MKRFPDICLNVYFAEEHTEAEYIIVNAGLYTLADDYAASVATGDEAEEYREFAKALRSNLETALSNLSLHLPATPEMVIGLVFGVSCRHPRRVAHHVLTLNRPSMPSRSPNPPSHGCSSARPRSLRRPWAGTAAP